MRQRKYPGDKKHISLFNRSNYNRSKGIASNSQIILLCVSLGIVLLLCFLGRCCIIPVVHATNFEINNRAYATRMDKNALC